MPLASKARRTWSRVDSYTSSPLSDSRRFNAVSDTRALSASVSCVQPSNARAARDCRAAIMHDHIPLGPTPTPERSEEHTSALQSLMRISYDVYCLKKKKN